MQSLKQNKILLALFGISLVAFLIYHFGGLGKGPVIDPVLMGNQVVSDQTTTEILGLLNRMQQASIDGQLFSSTAWTSLVDQSATLPNDTPGRQDLFGGSLRSQIAPVSTTTGQR